MAACNAFEVSVKLSVKVVTQYEKIVASSAKFFLILRGKSPILLVAESVRPAQIRQLAPFPNRKSRTGLVVRWSIADTETDTNLRARLKRG